MLETEVVVLPSREMLRNFCLLVAYLVFVLFCCLLRDDLYTHKSATWCFHLWKYKVDVEIDSDNPGNILEIHICSASSSWGQTVFQKSPVIDVEACSNLLCKLSNSIQNDYTPKV